MLYEFIVAFDGFVFGGNLCVYYGFAVICGQD
jgi:hypothetical protein